MWAIKTNNICYNEILFALVIMDFEIHGAPPPTDIVVENLYTKTIDVVDLTTHALNSDVLNSITFLEEPPSFLETNVR